MESPILIEMQIEGPKRRSDLKPSKREKIIRRFTNIFSGRLVSYGTTTLNASPSISGYSASRSSNSLTIALQSSLT